MSWKNTVCLLGALLFTGNAFGACTETTYTLPNGGDASYDDYLYASTAKYEQRKEGQTVRAYVCGQSCVGCCGVGEVIRLSNAVIGSGASNADAVYKCVNNPVSDRTGYGWQATVVDSYCTVGAGTFKYNNLLKLYEYNNKYCSEINEIQELGTILGIVDGDLIAIASSKDITVQNIYNEIKVGKIRIKNKTKKMSASDLAKIQKLINKTEKEIRGDLEKLGVAIDGMQADINALEFDAWKNKIIDKAQSRRMDRLAKKIRGINKSLGQKVSEDEVVDIIADELKDYEFVEQSEIDNVIGLIEDVADDLKQNKASVGKKLRNLNWRVTKNEAQIAWVRFYNNLRNNAHDRQIKSLGDRLADIEKEILTEKDVEDLIEAELETARLNRTQLQQVRTQISDATRGLQIKLNRLTNRVNKLEAELDAVTSDLTKVKVQNWFNGIVQNVKNEKFKKAIKNLQKDMKDRPDEDDVMDMIQDAIDEAELNDAQLKQVKSLIDKEIDKLEGDVTKLRKRLNNLSVRVGELEAKVWWQGMQNKFQNLEISGLDKKMSSLATKINERTTEDQVMDLIEEALSEAELSDEQTKQVEEMIRESARNANARMDRINRRISNLTQRMRKVEWDVVKLKGKLALVDFENDVRYKTLRAKDEKFDKAIKKINKNIKDINKELDEKVSKEKAHKMIQKAVDDAAKELGGNLSEEIQNTFNQIVNDLNVQVVQYVGQIENRLTQIEADVADLQVQSEKLVGQIAGLQSLTTSQRVQINKLRAEVSTKTNPSDVIALIIANTQSLSNGQKQEVQALIVEYTKQLSEGQRAQVEAMIASYVDPQIKQLNADVSKVRQQEVARDKINSAMSVLNAFASGADVSVWKNEEGKFNTARLASDATAGVVLGTAGGLISNSIIKKNQIKKGFEDINCSVGGQVVSNYADEFMVGMQ